MVNIEYQEVSFTVPLTSNWNDLHKDVYTIATKGADFNGDRPFIFNAVTSPLLDGQALITLRGSDLSLAEAETKTLSVRTGEVLDLDLNVCNLASQTVRQGKKRNIVVRAPYDGWFEVLSKKYGFLPLDLVAQRNPTRQVYKSENSVIRIPSISLNFRAEILCAETFSKTWLLGVGRKKGYGFGMLDTNGGC
jgi:hypothetical protein